MDARGRKNFRSRVAVALPFRGAFAVAANGTENRPVSTINAAASSIARAAGIATLSTLFAAPTILTAAPAGHLENAPSGSELGVYVQVHDAKGEPIQGLAATDFQVTVDGRQAPLLGVEEMDRSDPTTEANAALHMVFYVSDKLSAGEKFRARRAVAALVAKMDLKRDSAAVYCNGALSGFTRDPRRLVDLARFFGEDVDRYQFGFPPPPPVHWRDQWPSMVPGVLPGGAQVADDLKLLTKRGVRSRLSEALSLFKPMTGWKALFYFGTDLPYRDDELERHDPRFAARILADAGFAVFAFNPSGADDKGTERLSAWAEETGGRAVTQSGDLRQAVAAAWSGLNHVYRVTYMSLGAADCRWHTLQVAVSKPEAAASHGGGFFSTVNGTLSLTERTFLTVALQPARFVDFPVEVAAAVEPTDSTSGETAAPRKVRVALRFPFSVSAPQGNSLEPEERFHQRFLFFLGVYDGQGSLLGHFASPAFFDLDSEQLSKSLAELARLDQEIEIDRSAAPAWLAAIVVVGRNERIAAVRFDFPEANQIGRLDDAASRVYSPPQRSGARR